MSINPRIPTAELSPAIVYRTSDIINAHRRGNLLKSGSTGQICLQFSFPWKENLWSRSVKPSRAALIPAAFRSSNLSVSVSPKRKSTPDGVLFFLEVPARFELANESFADSCLTTWPRYHMK